MPKYIGLLNFTDQGIRNIRERPARRQAILEGLRGMGITAETYLTIGPYDVVAIIDAPSDEVAARAALLVGSQGNVRTLTMKAFTEDEADQIIGGMPPAS